MKLKFGIIGNGFVGGATKILECEHNEMLVYDVIPEKCQPLGLKLEDLKQCDLIFIAVPTPMKSDGECNLNIVDNVMQNLKNIDLNFEETSVVIRSTVLPETTDNYGVYFMPEFLTEKNYINDFINCKDWIIGCGKKQIDTNFLAKFTLLIENAYKDDKIKFNNIISMLNKEAELAKYVRNTFLALKVSFCNEIYQLSKKLGINYNHCMKGVTCDKRINVSHTHVPGHDGKFGYGGTCFPKDTNALKHFFETHDVKSLIISGMVERNETIDRPELDWKADPRAFKG